MKKVEMNKSIILMVLVFLFAGCDQFFGEKTDIEFIDKPVFQARDVAYVPIQPFLKGFVSPSDILTGFDELLYVVDEGSEEIICFDEAANELGRLNLKGVHHLAQDRKLNLLALGKIEKKIAGVVYELSCIYRIDLANNGNYGLPYANVVDTIVHPFYATKTFKLSDAAVVFTDIAVRHDNGFLVSRTGLDNNVSKLGGPDDAMLHFSQKDEFITPINISLSGGGFYRNYFKQPLAVTTFCQPPQITAQGNGSFVYTTGDQQSPIKTRVIGYIESEFGSSYSPQNLPVGDTSKADGFLLESDKFFTPSGITTTGDGSNYIFVVDASKDSVFQFTFNGFEGINPPPAYPSGKFIRCSFGGSGSGFSQFKQPVAVAYKNKILYVADKGNARISRFMLSTDFK